MADVDMEVHMHDDHDHDHLHDDDHGHMHADGDDGHSHDDDHGHAHGGLTRSQIKTFKVVFIFVYFLITYVGLIPRVLGSCRTSKATLSFMNCFAGGVFFSIALIHLFPEGGAQYDEWAAGEGIEDAFPLFYTMVFVGFLISLLVDKVACSKHQKPVGSQA